MGEIRGDNGSLTLREVRKAIAFDQPRLRAVENGKGIHVDGTFLIHGAGVGIDHAGPIGTVEIEAFLDYRFPRVEPRVFEVGGQIPRIADRHINPDGDCCVTVWEDWLVGNHDHSFAGYLNGPLREYFIGQLHFEKSKKWPFDERSHGASGLVEAYADALEIKPRKQDVLYHLRLLSKPWPKGHWKCPCGSGEILRNCHREKLWHLHQKIQPYMARRMLSRLKSMEQIEARNALARRKS